MMIYYYYMSIEKIANINNKNFNIAATQIVTNKKTTGRVDINHLIARARDAKNKEKKSNLIIFGLFSSLFLVVGIILSF